MKSNLKDYLTSKDWVSEYKPYHVDIDLKMGDIFSSSDSSVISSTSSASTSTSTSTSSKNKNKRKATAAIDAVPALKDMEDHAAVVDKHTDNKKQKKEQQQQQQQQGSGSTDWWKEYWNDLSVGNSAGITTTPTKPTSHKTTTIPPVPTNTTTPLVVKYESLKPPCSSSLVPKGPITKITSESSSGFIPSVDLSVSVDFSPFINPSSTDFSSEILFPASSYTQQNKPSNETATAETTALPSTMESSTNDATTVAATATPTPTNKMTHTILEIEQLMEQDLKEVASKKKQQKKKKKAKRNRDPDVKIYVEPTDLDCLLGRGGRSNHHPGNKKYRQEVLILQGWYKSSQKNEKTDLSQLLVEKVHEYGGRFLKQEKDGSGKWYIVTNIVARRKCSQALREHIPMEERLARRAAQKKES
eukprot:CAMPEP_0202458878 /NCGR_PEP_ID=MMETSP1360-20130828/28637_1 /ASSEMBLY_ACC=CAM_ASM_000848 /TAXON_ID=515479 /ORGANISM="Licmophora paradoxa, Strain CCMP2313" /LENGTH=415 /DNA_ID=CAMNT_0049079629 /DNA_START=185 /DNA_END=1432 /DNA_ORIENTATION=-